MAYLVHNTSLPAKSRTTNLGPFGEVIRATGPMAKVNPFRFSTKYQDDETDLVYYGYRYEKDGRWLSRDPIEEKGGLNLYGFVANDPLNNLDKYGLATSTAFGTPNVSNNRHNNYLIFQISCPIGSKVANVTVDYNDDNMYRAMYEAMYDPNTWVYSYSSAKSMWSFNLGNSFGGLQDVGRKNCLGDPVEVHAYMRTRLVAPGWEFQLWRNIYDTPDPNTMIGIYQENTRIRFVCESCCGRGQSQQ